jgi:hypothetical protein
MDKYFGFVLLGLGCVSGTGLGHAAEPAPQGVEFFEKNIRPVLVEHCYQCHSRAAEKKKKLKGVLYLDSSNGLHKGGETGPLFLPGKPAESLLIKALLHESDVRMPPTAKLPDNVIGNMRKWISLGAPIPADRDVEGQKKSIDWAQARQLWAFTLPVKHSPPKVKDERWPKTDLDRFILAELERRGLKPVQPATKRDLIRRASFDLIGLPPTPAEIQAFLNDDSPEAFAKVVDRLLASPHYGERWGRYWLDLARYADDQGNSFLSPMPTAYLYRDWVVKALNQDMPYDQFIRLQVAGDELPGPATDYVERLAGLGFQGLGPQFRKGAAGEAKAKADELEDRVDTLSRALLGLTVACARCHDHKFDPIPTRDYYSLAAAYNGATWTDRVLASPEAIAHHEAWQRQVQQKKADLDQWLKVQGRFLGRNGLEQMDGYLLAAWKIRLALREKVALDQTALARAENLQPYFLSRWVKFLEGPREEVDFKLWRAAAETSWKTSTFKSGKVSIPEDLRRETAALKARVLEALRELNLSEQPPKGKADKPSVVSPGNQELFKLLWHNDKAPFFVAPNDVAGLLDETKRKELAQHQTTLAKLVNAAPPLGPMTPSVRGGGEGLRVFVRGNPTNLGEPAPPGFLRILRDDESNPSGRFTRLDLANAIATPKNPLTARVFVNRVWHYHFGRGIVATPGNFGKLGIPPTHPDLLDTLAAQFMESGWSIKQLHRRIMLSATYQLSSGQDAANTLKDPDNYYLWRMSPRRLDIEALRDSMLTVAGKLDPRVGGPALDLKNPGLKEIPGFPGFSRLNGLDMDNPANGRRTIYCTVSRYAPNTALVLFDFPDPNVSSDQRNSTTVPQQQLFVLNSNFTMAMGRAFARRLEQLATRDEERIHLAWEWAYGRPPNKQETQFALDFLQSARRNTEQDKLSPWEQLAHALISTNEFTFVP